ncbi:MAG: YqhA family protein [Desulfovibrio sp.]|jgi:uncharacterized membrane protein YqhA|nr:YqhA family protein [Desulfovibrio sp.]
MKIIEAIIETFLFNSRFITILAVLGTLAASIVMFLAGTLRIWSGTKEFYYKIWLAPVVESHNAEQVLALFVNSVDNYLFAMVLLIFSMGIYELFISEIDPASRREDTRPDWLKIRNLDQLKESLGKVILMILIVTFFEKSMHMDFKSPLDLLYLGIGILMVAGALFLTHALIKKEKDHE